MPSHMASSFASAAAGQGSGRDSRSGRGDGRGSGDWARREARSTNGTLTLRRSSTTPFASTASQGESQLSTSSSEIQSSQQASNSAYDLPTDARYSKNQLLDIYRAQEDPGAANGEISRLFVNNWNPERSNGANGRSGWGKSNDGRDTYGPEICWDINGSVRPVGLQEMAEEEKILFSSDVNSPLKPPPQNTNKDPNAQGLGANGRKTSISHAQGSGAFGLSSPVSSRPGVRRQQTSDSVTGLPSPAGTGRFSREDASSFFNRKFNDSKEGDDRAEESKSGLPFGGLMRSNTAGSALGNGPPSPWGPPSASAAMSPMGNFGSFVLGGAAPNPPTPSEKRPGLGSMRGESRLAHLMPKDASEEPVPRSAERSWRPRPRTDTDPFGDESPAGSAALGGGQDTSPPNPQRRAPGLDTPVRGASSDFGFSDMPGFRDQHPQSHQTPQGHKGKHEPLSPSETNPYRSPPEDRNENEEGSFDGEPSQQSRLHGLGGIPEHGLNSLGALPRGFSNAPFEGSDRSQTSSAGASKGFPTLGSLGGLGGISGWPSSGNPIGTPDRENRAGFPTAFGNSIFGNAGELQSPTLGGLGSMFGPGPSGNIPGTNTIGRGSKLGSLFPAAMQAQMQVDNDNSGEGGDGRQSSTFGAIGRGGFPSARETESPIRTGRHPFEDLFPPTSDTSRNQGPLSSTETAPGQSATSFAQSSSAQSNYQQSQGSSDSSNQLPATQQRMMVMPDRMRWVYLDPQGHVQGPWSGLEMHDWYKASFFTADLSVKKVEDSEFEPLGQLIRRIGNSREPFLVPQIGIPHGPPTTQAGTPFAPAATAPGTSAGQPGSVQPPFAGAFPSFGTTLTAEQQNNLERRKQEEQYLMARQREFLAQQQVNMKQMQMGGLPSGLHHHSSAHSLQSQPSFGSMTSPIGMPSQPPLPAGTSFFDQARPLPGQAPSGVASDFFREDELARLSLQDRQQLFNAVAPGSQPSTHAQQIAAIFGQPPGPQREAARAEQHQNDPEGFKARLREFEQLREQHDLEEAAQSAANISSEPIAPPQQPAQEPHKELLGQFEEQTSDSKESEILSLTQQVQKAASAKQSPISIQPESPWAKVNTNLPMPFPPPQSTTPLPAPTAQRGHSNLPEALNAEARSRSETPEVAAAASSLAPWAKEPVEAAKGPSLKEIQESEAKKAAKAEEAAAAARRALHEQELKMRSSPVVAPAPGLPTTSTWGSTASPSNPAATVSPWAKSTPSKAPVASNASSTKKTLADIQREEQLRKQKLAAATAAAQPAPVATGKRYADLASKTTATAPASGSAWSTVGAGGKVKIPTGPAAAATAAPPAIRSLSSANVATTSSTRAPARPVATTRSVTTSGATAATSATDEFAKWAKGSLAKGLNSDINVDDFVHMLSTFPAEAGIIADSVYANSQLMDGRRFAEEFLRRRKLAEKGVVEPSNTGSGTGFSTVGDKSSGGWSEVAKKGPPKEEPTAGFKVVPNKKKGKK
ncbi:GYF protein [Venustampulla echinocandica]|uniref:GYF protein n=1 Tax=Venustampulla echinocandica TaxID=2656787 RepID=A0A370TAH4_9HELO|nr:GYF protein [Venustampulla echinocandica]RDL30795.1 GYF protein [Venustampulla echinocandica]